MSAKMNRSPVGSLINYRVSFHAALMTELQFDPMPSEVHGNLAQADSSTKPCASTSPVELAGACSGKALLGAGGSWQDIKYQMQIRPCLIN